jgi:2,4-dienoyl-CoA reductase-like NADH-dependent reductase (Old Yellow Enzyme family)/thioredoxin reductase
MANEPRYPDLFRPGRIGSLRLRNRTVMAPMGSNLASETGGVTDELIAHYARRARGGVGLVIVENTAVAYPLGRNGATHLRLDGDAFIPGLRRLVEAVQREGAAVAVQLNHAGAWTSPARTGGLQPVAPSDVPIQPGAAVPRPLSVAEIETLVGDFARAAQRARKAGFDGIEIHGAHGYLISEFISPYTNRREDAYGGSMENRLRFPLQVIRAVREAVGPCFPLWMRMNGDDFLPGGNDQAACQEIARRLAAAGLDALHVSSGMPPSHPRQVEPMRFEQGWKLYLAAGIRELVDVPVIAPGVIREPEVAQAALAAGRVDFVALGRTLLADPDWAGKAAQGAPGRIRRCISCNVCSQARGPDAIPLRCSLNPLLGREVSLGAPVRAERPRRVLVVGGGPAGVEAARVAALRGHAVTLCEREGALGGQVRLGHRPPGKGKLLWPLEDWPRALQEAGVEVRTGFAVTPEWVAAEGPDAVIVATGARPWVPPIPGVDGPQVTTAWEVLQGEDVPEGRRVVVVGGGSVGCETAEYLAEHGNRVLVLEMLPEIALDVEPTTRMDLLAQMEERGIDWRTEARVARMEPGRVLLAGGREEPADRVVMATGSEPAREFAESLADGDWEVYEAGDCRAPRRIVDAVYEGHLTGRAV